MQKKAYTFGQSRKDNGGLSSMRQQVGLQAKQKGNDISPSQTTSAIILSRITHRSTSQMQNQKWRHPSHSTLLSIDTAVLPHWPDVARTMIARITQCPCSRKPKHLWVPSKRKRPTSADVAISPRFLTYISYARNRKRDIQVAPASTPRWGLFESAVGTEAHRIKIKPQNGAVDAMPMSIRQDKTAHSWGDYSPFELKQDTAISLQDATNCTLWHSNERKEFWRGQSSLWPWWRQSNKENSLMHSVACKSFLNHYYSLEVLPQQQVTATILKLWKQKKLIWLNSHLNNHSETAQ